MALFGRKNANKNNDSPKGENKQDPAQKDERIAGNEPEPAQESAPPPSAPAPAAEPQPEEKPQEPQETQQTQPDRPAPEPFLPLNGVTAQSSPAPSAGGPSRYHTPEGFDFSSSNSSAGTSTMRSMRSSSGPEMRLRYWRTDVSDQVQRPEG